MASSNFTANLGLCSWSASDRPKRADFISDNTIIDTTLGGHIANTGIHVTSAEKAKLNAPFDIVGYSGSGTQSYSYNVGYTPKAVIVFKKNSPLVTVSSTNVTANAAVAAYGAGGSTGLSITSNGFQVQNTSASSSAPGINLNETDELYTAIVFK